MTTDTQENNEYNKNAPTKKILEYAQDIAKRLSMPFPAECENSFKACADFVDKYKPLLPPTIPQLQAIRATQKRLKIKAPEEAFQLASKATEFLKTHNNKV